MEKYSDKEIIEGLKEHRQEIVSYLYLRYLPMVRHLLNKEGGNIDLAEDLFQEGIYGVLIQLANPDFTLKYTFKTYFYGICYNQWLLILRKKSTEKTYFLKRENDDENDDLIEQTEKLRKESIFWEIFEKLDEKCRTIIKLLFRELSLKEISDIMGLSYGYLRRKKCECTDDLLCKVRQHPEIREGQQTSYMNI